MAEYGGIAAGSCDAETKHVTETPDVASVGVQWFFAAGLVDEITISTAPVLLGRGSRLFGDLDRDVLLTLRGHHSTQDDGLVRATYAVQLR